MNLRRAVAPLLLSLGFSAAVSLPAQTPPIPETEIRCEKSEVWSTDTETHGYFEGNVVVTGNNIKITCDRLEILASGLTDRSETVGTLEKFKYLLAVGKVRIVQGEREANCGRAEVFPRENKVVLTENPVVIDHGGPVTWVGDELTLLRGDRRVVGRNVRMTFPPIKDLGFDRNAPAPKPTDAAAPAPAPEAPPPPK